MKVKRFQRLSSIIVLFASVGFLFGYGIPDAFANPGIGATNIPSTPAVDFAVRLGPQGTLGATFTDVSVRAYSPADFGAGGTSDIALAANPSDCTFNDHPEVAGKFWDLYATDDGSGNPGPALLQVAVGEAGLVRFGDQGNAEPDANVVLMAGQSGPLYWNQDTGEGSEATSTDVIDELVSIGTNGRVYSYVVCGTENPTGGGDPFLTASLGFFGTKILVGGTQIPISPVSLLVAGVFTSPAVILSLAGATTGIAAITITKLRNKKQ